MGASKKQCEELLEFIRHLAEDDKEGVMAVKVSTRAPPLASVYQSVHGTVPCVYKYVLLYVVTLVGGITGAGLAVEPGPQRRLSS